MALSALCVTCLLAAGAAAVAIQSLAISPRLLSYYVERRASGHNALIESTGSLAGRWLYWADRGDLLPRLDYPAWVGASDSAQPKPPQPGTRQFILVGSAKAAAAALDSAAPGDVISFLPGKYRFTGHALTARRAGREDAPITVRAERVGEVVLEFSLLEGFHVSAPHWVFENLVVQGTCAAHDDCEHAFHVVGAAHNTVIRNNVLRDFNAHIKINGDRERFPDDGRIESNTLVNSSPRRTDAPVTPIDLVAASGWLIEANLIADFVKVGGDQTSYGGFAKGGGTGNRFIRNVVLCEHRLRSQPGRRVGLSFGNGGSGRESCRDRRCVVEHDDGLMANNLIASCSDEGIYLNRASRSRLVQNTVLDTAGVTVRFPESSARAVGNLVDGPLRARDGATLDSDDNLTPVLALSFVGLHPVRLLFENAGELDLRWASSTPRRRSGRDVLNPDLCGAVRPVIPAFGAAEDFLHCPTAAARVR